MNIKAILSGFLLLTICCPAFSQKIKYKELFVLLSAKSYAEYEIYLKRYLKDNTENPNAYLFMGLIYEDKAAKLDALKDTRTVVTMMDSAIFFFEKAQLGITEKEIKKNEEYYQSYNRRNARTGEFGVNISDIRLDLETKIKKKERGTILLTMKSQFVTAENKYVQAQKMFIEIQKKYANNKELFLRADESLIMELRRLAGVYDSCHISFNDYKASADLAGKIGHKQDLDPQEILDYKKDGITPTDFYADDLKIWDYKRWALSTADIIEKELFPIKDQLVAIDAEINGLQQKLKRDSTSIRADISAVRGKTGFATLRKIDHSPLPLKIFDMKLAELDFGSQVAEDRPLRDSTNVMLKANAVRHELALVRRLDSLTNIVYSPTLEEDIKNYEHFVKASFGSPAAMESQLKSTREFAAKEVALKDIELTRKMQSLRWIVNGLDSIPLFLDVPSKSRFKPLVLQDEKFTAGLQYADSIATGYFYLIMSSRKPTVKAAYQVDKQVFKKRNIPYVKAITTQDEKGLVYFVLYYSESRINDKYPATIVKIYRNEGLAWSVNYTFDQIPAEIAFLPDSFELSVKTKSSLGEVFGVAFDKTGKMIK